MSEWNDIATTIKNEGITLAQDWVRATANQNRPQVQVAPQPVATMPAAQVQQQVLSNKYLVYGLFAVALVGVIYLFKPSKGKK